jgi:hypothetical protein
MSMLSRWFRRAGGDKAFWHCNHCEWSGPERGASGRGRRTDTGRRRATEIRTKYPNYRVARCRAAKVPPAKEKTLDDYGIDKALARRTASRLSAASGHRRPSFRTGLLSGSPHRPAWLG